MLTDSECKNATCTPDKKRERFTDGAGLYLEVSPAGSKRWFWKTYADGKEGRMALGSYPDVTLKAARMARDAAKLHKSEGRDPVQVRKIEKLKAIGLRAKGWPDYETQAIAAARTDGGGRRINLDGGNRGCNNLGGPSTSFR